MVKFKLIYFNARGRAEVARLLFTLANEKFEDVRLTEAQWHKMKESTPFGRLPLLEVDGAVICQSNAIGRFLANRFGFAGKSAMEKVRADMIVDCVEDMLQELIYINLAETSDDEKRRRREEYARFKLPSFLAYFEKLLKANNAGAGFFVGDHITWADLAVYNWCTSFSDFGINVSIDDCPALANFLERIAANPRISQWNKRKAKGIV